MSVSKYSSREIGAGVLLSIAALALLAATVVHVSSASIWRKRSEIYIIFENVNALRPDAPVRYNGVEVGRVKSMRMLHLDEAIVTERFAALSKRDVNNLPLWPETVRKQLLSLDDAQFDAACRQALAGRTMIELCVEVMRDTDASRYRVDDQARVVSSIFGDTGVEIISGSGQQYELGSRKFILGQSGDFFSNLSRSMGDVKEILARVTDAVGTQDRRNFERAQARFEPIQNQARSIGETARERLNRSTEKYKGTSAGLDAVIAHSEETLAKIKPEMKRSSESIQARMEKMNSGLGELRPALDDAIESISTDATALRTDFDAVMKPARADYESSKTILNNTVAQVKYSNWRITDMAGLINQAAMQSAGDVPRILKAAEQSGINLIHFGFSAKYNKDLFISNGDEGEHELATLLDIYRNMKQSSRRVRQSSADLDSLTQMLDVAPAKKSRAPMIEILDDDMWTVSDAGTTPAPSDLAIRGVVIRSRLAQDRLSRMLQPLDDVVEDVDRKVYPPFERKKAAWAGEVRAEREK